MIIRCPRLGHEVEFSYCRSESGTMPCERILSCWQGRFRVEEFLKADMGPEAWEAFKARNFQDKISTLIGLVEEARSKQKWPK